jgi:hypothetical protein
VFIGQLLLLPTMLLLPVMLLRRKLIDFGFLWT